MTGFVTLYQSNGNPEPSSNGVTVRVQGTSLSATTDSAGRWTINGVTSGGYTVTYTDTGYGMSEQQGVQFVGGTDFLGTITLAQPATFAVGISPLSNTDDTNGSLELYLSGNIPVSYSGGSVLIAAGLHSNVSASDPTKYLYALIPAYFGPTYPVYLYASYLYAAGFKSGMTAYLVSFPLSGIEGDSYSSYFDIATGRTVYTSLGAPSNVIALTVP
jgi:hypothetical protein